MSRPLPLRSTAQLAFGLLVCFFSFAAYALIGPFLNVSDDRLSQLCQAQIFFALVSSMILQTDPGLRGALSNQNMDIILGVFTFLPFAFAIAAEFVDAFGV